MFVKETDDFLDHAKLLSGDKVDTLKQQLFNMQSDAKWGNINYTKLSRLSRVKTPRNAIIDVIKVALTEKVALKEL